MGISIFSRELEKEQRLLNDEIFIDTDYAEIMTDSLSEMMKDHSM